jgi:glycosyltransferase involved in cell wall biosynthesis
MTVAILIPVLRRPHRVEPLLDSIEQATPEPHEVVFICSPEDDAERDAVRQVGLEPLMLNQRCRPGDYARKINAGVNATTAPFVLLAADDLRFRKSWFERAASRMSDTVGVVGTNDLGNRAVMRGNHATHSLVARWYCQLGTVDNPDQVLHEGYDHNFVDNEFVQTAQARGAWAFAPDSVVEHLHPSWEKGEWDSTYERGRSGWYHDQRLYRRRARLWAGVTV